MRGGRKYVPFLHHEKRSHKRSDVLHLRWQYILLGPPVCFKHPIIVPGCRRVEKKSGREHTFVRTAIEAKEFPKFIPMTVCGDGISIGACALPFGTCPLRDILRFYRGRGMRVWAAGVNGGCRVSLDPQNQDYLILSNLKPSDA